MLDQTIRKLRRDKGMTQQELGELLGVSTSAVGMYEQGRRKPDMDMLRRLAEVFGVTVDFLIREEPEADGPRELTEMMDSFKRALMQQQALMFNGDPLNQDDIEKIVQAMNIGAALAVARSKGEQHKKERAE